MPTFYDEKEKNIRRTYFYLSGFFLFIIGIGWSLSYFFETTAILWIAVIISVAMSFTSYWYSDKIVLSMSKAKEIKKDDYPEFYRIAENLSISKGLPMPRLFVVDDPHPNAFATGRNPEHGVVAVTTGLLEKLNRQELEGVVAHEMAHIENYDILISSVVVVLVGVVVLVADIFFRMAFFGGMRNREGKGGVFILIIAVVFMILSPVLAQIMKFAISRKREYLADTTAVLSTRYPEGLASALEKISRDPNQLRTASDSTAHMYISNPFRGKEKKSWFRKLFMTHPPTEERIKKIRGIDI
ncbi:MAG: M48 family metallopeptidase [Candidatus Pacebacteria bacterium]|nr:M48 family metallopeptidase [Candidatus Paceibacterota bacterium]